MRKLLHCLAWVFIFGNLFLIGMVAWWLIHPYNLPSITEPIPIENENKIVAVGEPIKMKLQITKTSDMTPSIVQHDITCNDGNLVTMASSSKTLQKGTYTIHSSGFILPPKVVKGSTCQFNFINTYKLNPLRSETIIYSSEQFKVKEN